MPGSGRHRSNVRTSVRALPLFAHAIAHERETTPAPTPGTEAGPSVVPTGLASVDAILGGGLPRGRVTLLAARPAMGATSLLLGATLAAARRGQRVLFVSERLSDSQLRGRLVVLEARVNGHRFRAGLVSDEDRVALAAARERIPWQSLTLVCKKSMSAAELDDCLFSYRPHLVVADVRPPAPDAHLPRERFVGLVAGVEHLAELAARQRAAVVVHLVLPQGPGAPVRRDLPGMGAIADSFDTVLLLHREEVTVPRAEDTSAGLVEVRLVHRGGRDVPPTSVRLRFDQRFAGLSDL